MNEQQSPNKKGSGSPGSVVMIVLGSLVGLLALALVAGGGVALWADHSKKDKTGFFTTKAHQFQAPTYAITHEGVTIGDTHWIGSHASIRVRATSADSGRPVFVGIAHSDDLSRYLADVAHSDTKHLDYDPFTVEYKTVAGTKAPSRPASQPIWAASAVGTKDVSVEWPIKKGHWSVVVMNADGSRGVAANVDLGARVSHVGLIIGGLFGGGAILLGLSALLVLGGARGLGGDDEEPVADGVESPAPASGGGAEPPAGTYPVRLEGRLDEPLNRWLWLVKWLAAIPHYIVLVLLWVAFAVLTVVAWLALLATGRYPRRIFEFNVGVLRWTWRVSYYATSALGTDRYPPFTLAEVPNYPATFSVEYPGEQSRTSVFFRWILAIPQLLVIGFFTGGAWFGWMAWNDNWSRSSGGGLITLLVFVAGVILLVTGKYPRELYNFVMGLNRWVYRVFAYTALMTDQYPPFRFDAGATEPPAEVSPAVPAGA